MEIKIQCDCGQRYSFDIEPVNGQMPVAVNCPRCGANGTAAANQIIRQNLAASQPPSPPTQPPSADRPRLRVTAGHAVAHTAPAAPPPATPATPEAAPAAIPCHRHPRQPSAARCVVCQKPICPECMAQFGYLCSINCRYQAEQQRIHVPVYKLQKTHVQANWWRKMGRIAALIAVAIVALISFGIWYEFTASQPKQFYSLKLSSEGAVHAKFLDKDKILIVESKRIALHDIKTRQDTWSTPFGESPSTNKDSDESRRDELHESHSSAVSARSLAKFFSDSYERPLIYLTKEDIWVCFSTQLLSFDQKTGAKKQTVPLPGHKVSFTPEQNSMLIVSLLDSGKKAVTRVELPSGAAKTEEVKVTPVQKQYILDEVPPDAATPGYLLQRELSSEDGDTRKKAIKKVYSQFHSAGVNAVEMQVRLIEPNVVMVEAMKKPGPSALNANTSVSTSARTVAEEIFNDIKRSNTGGMKQVDESRYSVTLRRLLTTGAEPWSSEVIGPPAFFSEKTVDLLAAGKSLFIFDKQNKKIGEAKLTYPIADHFIGSANGAPSYEVDNTLYFFDQGVLTAFDLPACTVRWRLPSVGVSRVQSDGKGHLYVETTSAAPEDIQYSEQIKMGDQTVPILMKVDARSGKTLWKTRRVVDCRLTGDFLYAMSEQAGEFPLVGGLREAVGSLSAGVEHFRLYRIKPSSGKRLWEFYNQGSPDEVDVYENRILLRFDNQLLVMKYFSF